MCLQCADGSRLGYEHVWRAGHIGCTEGSRGSVKTVQRVCEEWAEGMEGAQVV